MADNAYSEFIVKQTYGITTTLFDKRTKQSKSWHTRETEVAVGALYESSVSQEQRNKCKERDKNMAKVMIQFDILTKYVIWVASKAVNVISCKRNNVYDDDVEPLDEEIWFMSNLKGSGFPTTNYHDPIS